MAGIQEREDTLEKLRRYIDLAEIWTDEGFDSDTQEDMNEFWELSKEFSGLHDQTIKHL